MEDGRLGLGGKELLEEADRLLDHGQRLLTLERFPILEHLHGNERVGVGDVPTDVEANDAGHRSAGAMTSSNAASAWSVLSGRHCTLKRTTIITLPPGSGQATWLP